MSDQPTLAYLVSRHPLMGGEYYRATRPAALAARAFGWGAAVCDRMATMEDGGKLCFVTPNDQVVTPDIIILRPIREWSQAWTDQAHANRQLVIADLDDDIWSHQDWEGVERPNDDNYDDWFPNVDAVLVSTRYLRNRIVERGHKAPVIVAPNCYDPYGLNATPSFGGMIGTRLWLSGRMEGDLELYDQLIQPLLEEFNLGFIHVGAEDGHRFTDRGWDFNRLVEVGSVPVPLLPQALEGLSIGAICMSDHPYNLAKTETHAAELAAMGVPLVAASRHRLYRHIPGRVDPTPEQVRGRVEALSKFPNFWESESTAAREWARKIGFRNETDHLHALHSLVGVLLSEQRVSLG